MLPGAIRHAMLVFCTNAKRLLPVVNVWVNMPSCFWQQLQSRDALHSVVKHECSNTCHHCTDVMLSFISLFPHRQCQARLLIACLVPQ